MVELLLEVLQQALELNEIDEKKAEKIIEDFLFLLTAEKLLEKAEERVGRELKDKEEKKELRRLLSAELRARAEMIGYELLKKEGLL